MNATPPRHAQQGFSLVELLVVVAILGVLAASAVIFTKTDRVGEGSRQVSAILQEARRHAVSLGAVRADVVAANNLTYRTRVEFTTVGGKNVVNLWDLVENPAPATTYNWVLASSVTLPTEVQIYGVANAAQPNPGGALPGALPATTSKYFYPNGKADGFTVFLQKRGAAANHPDRYRVFVMPFMSVAQNLKGW